MKILLTLLLAACTFSLAFAQPSNDDCSGIIHLGEAPVCPTLTIYSNVDATPSNIGMDNLPGCFVTNPIRDVWFSFEATAAISTYEISVTGTGSTPITQPQMAIYRGDCAFDDLVLYDCAFASNDETSLSMQVAGLTPGITYYIRVDNWTATADKNWGNFEICVKAFVQTAFAIDENGTDLCSGTLYDTGGPTGNYGSNENHVFTICPSTPPGCLQFTLSQYNIGNGGDNLLFFDGPNTNSPLITTLADGASLSNNNTLGGVCLPIIATSGCLTVQFTSNAFQNLQGFIGTWECLDKCPDNGGLEITVAPDFSAIESALQNPYFDISVTSVNCGNESFAIFNQGDNTSLGMQDGLLLTTGRAASVANPASFHADNDLNLGGDADLAFLDATYGIGFSQGVADACVVELEVLAKTNRIGFDYVFGSDEYEEDFSPFSDDLMAVLISGPGITGPPGLNGQQNLAWVPGTNIQLIQIQRVNAATNWQYFRNNLNSENIVYNGLTSGFLGETKTLYAGAAITPCETYRIRLAIGDTDSNDDSGLFIQSSSVGYPSISINYNTGIDYLVEGCTNTPSEIVIRLPEALSQDFTPNVVVGGTATPFGDYQVAIPSPPTIPAGSTEISFPITVVADGMVEGTETIALSLTGDFGCGTVVFSSLLVEIKDQLDVNILPDQDTLLVCDGIFTADLTAIGANSYSWSPASVFSNPNAASTTATITTSQTVSVTGTLGTCTDTDEIFLEIVSPSIDIQPDGPLQICEGETIQLEAINNINNVGLEWSPNIGLSDAQNAVTVAKPSSTTTYTATVTATKGCTASDEITINVEPFDFPAWVLNDSVICQNSSIQLAAAVPATTTDFQWVPGTGLSDAAIADAVATPDETTTYTLTATSENGLCSASASVTLTVLPANVDILPDTIDLCVGDSALVTAITSTGGVGLTWSPTDSVVGAELVSVKPSVSTWYYARLEVGICTVLDSVFVRVDSLPQMTEIEAIPLKDTYCQGEVISLISSNYEQAFFPDIQFQWTPNTGVVSEDTLYNLAINAVQTTTYIREITNNACSVSNEIDIIVIPVANIEIMPENPFLCPGESVQLTVTADQPIEEWEWSPGAGLSCTDCTNPVATPPGTITYQVKGEFMGCPSFAQVTVQVASPPNYAFPANPFICSGDAITLNTVVDPNASYEWSNPDGSFLSNEAQPSVSPTTTTTYTMVAQIGNCPPVTDQITIIVQEDFVLTVENNLTICEGEAANLTASATNPTVQFMWSDVFGNQINPPVTGLLPGSSHVYILRATAPGSGNVPCFAQTETVIVQVYPDFEVTASDDQTISAGESVTLQATANLDGVTFIWETLNGDPVGEGASLTVSPCNSETYIVEGIHPNGCPGDTDTVMVTVLSSFIIDSLTIMQGDTAVFIHEGAELNATVYTTPNTIPGATYEWYLNGALLATTSGQQSGTFNIPELPQEVVEEQAYLQVVITNSDGCSLSLIDTIFILNNPVRVPNVFTPNGDGTNDVFTAVSIIPIDIKGLRIWNRWGKMVFDNEDGSGTWDGMVNEKAAASDVYIYEILYSIAGSELVYKEKGDVTLLR